MGLVRAMGGFFSLTRVINVLLAVIIWVQAVAQIVALTVLRRPHRAPSPGTGGARWA